MITAKICPAIAIALLVLGAFSTAPARAQTASQGATSESARLEEVVITGTRRTDRSVTDVCFDVAFTSLGTFSRTFREIVGETPSAYRRGNGPIVAPHCVQLAAMRPRVGAGDTT